MGQRHCTNYLFVAFIVNLVLNCYASNFKKPHENTGEKENKPKNFKMVRFYWKNSKALEDIESISLPVTKNRRQISSTARSISQSTTPSYIEFEYLDKPEDQTKMKNSSYNRLPRYVTENKVIKLDYHKLSRPRSSRPRRSSRITFHLNDPYFRRVVTLTKLNTLSTAKKNYKNYEKDYKSAHALSDNHSKEILSRQKHKILPDSNATKTNKRNLVTEKLYFIDTSVLTKQNVTESVQTVATEVNETVSTTVNAHMEKQTTLNISLLFTTRSTTNATIPEDRVKFFEMYDTNTMPMPPLTKFTKLGEYSENEDQLDDVTLTRKSNVDDFNSHVNRRHCGELNDTYGKKNIINDTSLEAEYNRTIMQTRKGYSSELLHKQIANEEMKSAFMFPDNTNAISILENVPKSDRITQVTMAQWSSYPFASVYVYKPTETHCDAAGISPHWLVAAASCLSRHSMVYSIQARSAYVTYCGEDWQKPERIAYVKRSMVHPKFNPRDELRRLIYNIGLIQVSESMSTSCLSWAPVTLMTHQFTAKPTGSIASAVGWGLDRFGTQYTKGLPHWPLTVYDALVFFGSCPGSYTYSKAKRQDDGAVNNIYCLLLPPYDDEEVDPVHGGLLLVGGKLVALYLQEERRPWGPQSAQYTGVWRLLPWVLDLAREPVDLEATLDV